MAHKKKEEPSAKNTISTAYADTTRESGARQEEREQHTTYDALFLSCLTPRGVRPINIFGSALLDTLLTFCAFLVTPETNAATACRLTSILRLGRRKKKNAPTLPLPLPPPAPPRPSLPLQWRWHHQRSRYPRACQTSCG